MDFSFAVCDACDHVTSPYPLIGPQKTPKAPNPAVGSRTRASRGSSAGQVLLSQLLQLLARRPKPGGPGRPKPKAVPWRLGKFGSFRGEARDFAGARTIPYPGGREGASFTFLFWPSRLFLSFSLLHLFLPPFSQQTVELRVESSLGPSPWIGYHRFGFTFVLTRFPNSLAPQFSTWLMTIPRCPNSKL